MFHDMEVLGPGPKDLIITTLVCPVVMVNVYSRMVGDVTTVHPVHCVWCVIQRALLEQCMSRESSIPGVRNSHTVSFYIVCFRGSDNCPTSLKSKSGESSAATIE